MGNIFRKRVRAPGELSPLIDIIRWYDDNLKRLESRKDFSDIKRKVVSTINKKICLLTQEDAMAINRDYNHGTELVYLMRCGMNKLFTWDEIYKFISGYFKALDGNGNFSHNTKSGTPLQYALKIKYKYVVTVLVTNYSHRCAMGSEFYHDYTHYNALTYAIGLGWMNVVDEILKHPDLCDVKKKIGYSNALSKLANVTGGWRRVYAAIEADPSIVSSTSLFAFGGSVLEAACGCGKRDIATLILDLGEKKMNINIGSSSGAGHTPLTAAIYGELNDVAIRMLDLYGDKCNLEYVSKGGLKTEPHTGLTALVYAIKSNMEDVALKILDYPEHCNMMFKDELGYDALGYAKLHDMAKVIAKLKSCVDILADKYKSRASIV